MGVGKNNRFWGKICPFSFTMYFLEWLITSIVSLLHSSLGLWSTGDASYINLYQVSNFPFSQAFGSGNGGTSSGDAHSALVRSLSFRDGCGVNEPRPATQLPRELVVTFSLAALSRERCGAPTAARRVLDKVEEVGRRQREPVDGEFTGHRRAVGDGHRHRRPRRPRP